MIEKRPLLVADKVTKLFTGSGRGWWRGQKTTIHALEDFNLTVYPGETVGLVGESGCGKTTAGRTLLRLYDPTDGKITFDGHDITRLTEQQLKPFRRRMQMVFQDPYSSLNPRMTIGDIVAEPLKIHKVTSIKEHQRRVRELLEQVGLHQGHAARYPHEFSGGQRQRIGIARALAVSPELIVCDEPVSALDVSIRVQIIELLQQVQEQYKIAYLFIAHDLAIVRYLCSRVVVMYLGKIVEQGPTQPLFDKPLHPYTRALLSAVLSPDPEFERQRERKILTGEIPDASNPPRGCRFCTRCDYKAKLCEEQEPPLEEIEQGRFVACHLAAGRIGH